MPLEDDTYHPQTVSSPWAELGVGREGGCRDLKQGNHKSSVCFFEKKKQSKNSYRQEQVRLHDLASGCGIIFV